MKYKNVVQGIFLSRPNRFIANVSIEGQHCRCHVKNTGRCKELLTEKAVVYLEKCPKPDRKTMCSLIGVQKGEQIVNIDSQAPNKVFHEALLNGKIRLPGFEELTLLKAEKFYGESRFDFYAESGSKKAFIEVKGVTLEVDGVAMFPDAPTDRGVKHLKELVRAKQDGFDAFIVFIIQMDHIRFLIPNDKTHAAFGDALRSAAENGVMVLAYECDITEDSMEVNGTQCPVQLSGENFGHEG